MQAFARLCADLDADPSPQAQLAALVNHLGTASTSDAAWAVYLLADGRPRQSVSQAALREAGLRAAGLDEWLFEACVQASGDLAEAISLIIPTTDAATIDDPMAAPVSLADWMETRLPALRSLDPEALSDRLVGWLRSLDPGGRQVLIRWIRGSWRGGVDRPLLQKALALHAGLEPHLIAQRLSGYTDHRHGPSAARYLALVNPATAPTDTLGGPHPFFMPARLDPVGESLPDRLGGVDQWLAEWQFDGLRAQVVKRAGQAWIWSSAGALLNERLPEVMAHALGLPDGTVLDGELTVWQDGVPAPASRLHQRLARKTLGRAVLAQAPVAFIAFDLLELGGVDWRTRNQAQRRTALESVMPPRREDGWMASPRLHAKDWADLLRLLGESHARGVRGLMLKHVQGTYGVGRADTVGERVTGWWAWKGVPMRVDAVLVYAQASQGADTVYTLAVWSRAPRDEAEAQGVIEAITRQAPARPDGLQLVTLTQVEIGLSEEERKRVAQVIRATTLEKFGPVRSLRPTLMVELAFDGLSRSARHKSGLALRSPRMLGLRDDKPLHAADSLSRLEALLPATTVGV